MGNLDIEYNAMKSELAKDERDSKYELELSLAKLDDELHGTTKSLFIYKPAIITITCK